MKTHIKYFAGAFMLLTFLSSMASAPVPVKTKTETVTILTSAVCEKCKARIEKVLKATDGVIAANLNVDNKKVKVKYDSAKMSADKIRAIISNTGYDADNVKANTEAFNKLPHCCQK